MDVTQLPFNRLVGLEPAPAGSGFLVSLPDGPQYTNHLGTVHASALLAVAEAGSGVFLLDRLGDSAGVVAVVRRLEAKFRRPASGRVSARVVVAPEEVARWTSELVARGTRPRPGADSDTFWPVHGERGTHEQSHRSNGVFDTGSGP
jgi:acyl-coenzyme A thioesterase PaaI-like protein